MYSELLPKARVLGVISLRSICSEKEPTFSAKDGTNRNRYVYESVSPKKHVRLSSQYPHDISRNVKRAHDVSDTGY